MTGEPGPNGVAESGLKAIFLSQRPTLLRFLRARGAGDAAEDLLHELWLRAESARPGPVADPLAYLYRMANNLMLDRHRTIQRRARRDTDWQDAQTGTLPQASDAPSPERTMIARDVLERAEAELASLGERTDIIFRKFRVEGMNQRAIAAELGVSLTTVEKHLQKAYRAMIDLKRRLDTDSPDA